MTTTIKPATVKLPVCPLCGQVSKIDAVQFGGRAFCIGKRKEHHKRTAMEMRTFKEVV